ncbi:MAG: hypothetical protein CSB24_01025 [Deltaproteobacteria bacterium]|nr:MAG: hypothetical protein CSB24_01025 [Deltaproteobacteria bacterium]
MALQGFDEEYYLTAKLAHVRTKHPEWNSRSESDLKEFMASVGLTPEQHYNMYGWVEGVGPNQYFDAAQYLSFKTRAMFESNKFASVEEAATEFAARWPHDPYLHYLQYGRFEGEDGVGINPSNAFDSKLYLEAKLAQMQTKDPDKYGSWTVKEVAAAFKAAGISPLVHCLKYGEAEGLVAQPVPAGEQSGDGTGGVPGELFETTARMDNLVGTDRDDVFKAGTEEGNPTLNAGDTIDGGAGTDTLKIYDGTQNSSINVIEMKNVEVVESDAETAGLIANEDVNEFWLVKGDGNQNMSFRLDQQVGFRDTKQDVETVLFDSAGGPADEATLQLDNSEIKTLNVANVETLNIGLAGENAVETDLKDAAVEKLVLSGEGSLDAKMATAAANFRVIDAANMSGELVLDASTAMSTLKADETVITTGSGDDTLTLDMGAAEANLNKDIKIDMGEGRDILINTNSVTINDAATVEKFAGVSNVEGIGVNAAATLTVNATQKSFDFYWLDGTANAKLTGVTDGSHLIMTGAVANAKSSVEMAQGQENITLELQATADDASLNGSGAGALTVNAPHADIISNLDGGVQGTHNKLDLTMLEGTKIKITGNHALDLKMETGGNLKVRGILVDASEFTGGLTYTQDGNTLKQAATGGDIIIASKGADQFNVKLAANADNEDLDAATATIRNFDVGADKVGLIAATDANCQLDDDVKADMAKLFTAAKKWLDEADQDIYVGQVGSDTYIFHDEDDAANFTEMVKLEGVKVDDLSNDNIVAVA